MKIKQMFKRVVAGILTTATLLTSISLPAFADGKYNGGSAGTSFGTIGNCPGFDDETWGYRYAIVDAETGKVQKDTLTKKYLVKDQVQFKENSALDLTMSSDDTVKANFVRTDPNTDLGYIPVIYSFKQLANGTQLQPKPVLYTVINEKTGAKGWVANGDNFETWMINEKWGPTLTIDGKKVHFTWAQYVINQFFSDTDGSISENMKKGKWKLTIEPLYMIPLYSNYMETKDVFGTGDYAELTNYDDSGNVTSISYSNYSGKKFFGTYTGSLKALYELSAGGAQLYGGDGGWQFPVIKVAAKCMHLEEDDYNSYC